jgi:uncharacterized ferritin-like protein (DUF455 family)
MQLEEFASTVLFGRTWEEKLVSPVDFQDSGRQIPLQCIPKLPPRPLPLSRFGKTEFPQLSELADPVARGRLLHFFANHELLAAELMALILLRFPRADPKFRRGLAHTLREEQSHLRLYVTRMQTLGVAFGDFPLSDYFWTALKDAATPLEFVVQMSLTLEQANLDYSWMYQKEMARLGDGETAQVFETVYREEIGHVKHGLFWFNEWRENSGERKNKSAGEDDWTAYLRLLPLPMTARRAKGPVFCAAGRQQAGFSRRYIKEMEIHSGSKGRPPTLWLYNPMCELEIARDKPGFTASEKVRQMTSDLEHLPAFLAKQTDLVLVGNKPDAEWLKQLQNLGFRLPEFRIWQKAHPDVRETKLAGIEPWGWSPDIFSDFQSAREKLISVEGANGIWAQKLLAQPDFSSTHLPALFSKSWSAAFLRNWLEKNPADTTSFGSPNSVGQTFKDWEGAELYLRAQLSHGQTILAKAPWGTAGTQNKKIIAASEIDSNIGRWVKNILREQGSIILERWLNKRADLSLQMEIGETSHKILGIRRFLTGGRLEYRGTYLEPKLNSLPPEILRFLHAKQPAGYSPSQRWCDLAADLAATLRDAGYQGPVGIDALVWNDPGSQKLFLKPVVEINPRWTMGRVALSLETHVLPGTPAVWLFIPARDLDKLGRLSERFPVEIKKNGIDIKIAAGVVFTSNPETTREVVTVLVVGRGAIGEVLKEGEVISDSFGDPLIIPHHGDGLLLPTCRTRSTANA